jgi:hypothetical protein
MRQLVAKLKPVNGFSDAAHLGLLILLPLLVFIMVRVDFIQLALAIILLSKWRMLAVRPRYWPANIRANSVDIIVGLSTLVFMIHTTSGLWQLVWAVAYGTWLIAIKPKSQLLGISIQALIAQLFGLMALFLEWPSAPLYGLVAGAAFICYAAARHFFDSFEEPYNKLLAYIWGYFAAALTWVLGHWLLFYGIVAQPTVFLTVIGYGLATLYYLDHYDRLSKIIRQQFVFIMVAIIIVILALSNWGDKIV